MNYYNENDPKAAAWLRTLIAEGVIPPGTVDERSIKDVLPSDLTTHTQCHFFAGIGGWSYALQLANWPAGQQAWTGSCPCQPFSVAGKNLGVEDPRHLWPDFLRLIAQCSPPVVFGEQVASKAGKVWLSRVRADLEALGYGVGGADLCAAGVSAPHIRQRLYWVAERVAHTYPDRCGAERGSRPGREEPDLEHRSGVSGVAESRQQQPGRSDNGPGESLIKDEGRTPSQSGRSGDARGMAYTECDGGRADLALREPKGRATDGGTCRLANVQFQRLEGLTGDGDNGDEPRWEYAVPAGSASESSRLSGLDHPTNYRTLIAGSALAPSDGEDHGVSGTPSWVGDPACGGCGVVGNEALAGSRGHTQFASWSRFDLIHCRDNKTRRIESGTFPLVAGLPRGVVPSGDPSVKEAQATAEARVARLRGYGNSIVPQLAAEFIGAYQDLTT